MTAQDLALGLGKILLGAALLGDSAGIETVEDVTIADLITAATIEVGQTILAPEEEAMAVAMAVAMGMITRPHQPTIAVARLSTWQTGATAHSP